MVLFFVSQAPVAAVAPSPAPVDIIAALTPLVEELRYRDQLMMQRMEAMMMKQQQMADDERLKRDKVRLGFRSLAPVESSRASPPHRLREDALAHPADTSISNLASALGLLLR